MRNHTINIPENYSASCIQYGSVSFLPHDVEGVLIRSESGAFLDRSLDSSLRERNCGSWRCSFFFFFFFFE